MPRPKASMPVIVECSMKTALPLRFRNCHRRSMASPSGRKRSRSESEDDFSTTDSESCSDSKDDFSTTDSESCSDSKDDATEDGQDSDSSASSQELPSRDLSKITHRLIDQVFPACSAWISSARYVCPPEYRLRPRKRSKTSGNHSPSIFMETEDPQDPSTILILRINGYFHFACPFFVSDPARHKSCSQDDSLHSIKDLIKHLRKRHPHPIYCPICGTLFDGEAARDKHICSLSCACRDFEIERGVTFTQLRNIKEKDDRNKREEERWRCIYKQLFPEAEKPSRGAAYIKEGIPLAASMARDYWDSRDRRLIKEYVMREGFVGAEELARGEQLALCELAGRELTRRVVEIASSNAEKSDEAEWEAVKVDQE